MRRKAVFEFSSQMRRAKAQTRLRIRTVWSGPLLSVFKLNKYCKMYQRTARSTIWPYYWIWNYIWGWWGMWGGGGGGWGGGAGCNAVIVWLSSSFHSVYPFTSSVLKRGKGDIDSQCRPWSDAAERGVWSVSTLFALTLAISIKRDYNKN